MINNHLNIYNNLIKLTRNKNLYENTSNTETFSDRLSMFFMHFSFFLKSYKDQTAPNELQNLYDFVFKQIELSIREIGYGDVSVNKKMKEYVNLMHYIISFVENWENINVKKKAHFFSDSIIVNKESSFYIDYFDKYSIYLSKKTFNYFTNDVISHKF